MIRDNKWFVDLYAEGTIEYEVVFPVNSYGPGTIEQCIDIVKKLQANSGIDEIRIVRYSSGQNIMRMKQFSISDLLLTDNMLGSYLSIYDVKDITFLLSSEKSFEKMHHTGQIAVPVFDLSDEQIDNLILDACIKAASENIATLVGSAADIPQMAKHIFADFDRKNNDKYKEQFGLHPQEPNLLLGAILAHPNLILDFERTIYSAKLPDMTAIALPEPEYFGYIVKRNKYSGIMIHNPKAAIPIKVQLQ